MRNVWKGMILGALAGAGVGLTVDGLEVLGVRSRHLSGQALSGAKDLAADGRHAVHDAHLPDRAADLVAQGRDVIVDAHLPEKARDRSHEAVERASEALESAKDHLPAG